MPVGEHAFRRLVSAGQEVGPRGWKTDGESVDTVENAGLTLVEPVDNNSRIVVRRCTPCYHRPHPRSAVFGVSHALEKRHLAPNTCRLSQNGASIRDCPAVTMIRRDE